MELNEVAGLRRSIRKYKDKKVDRSLIEECIKFSINAPTWKNSQTQRYYVVDNEELVNKLREEALPEGNAKKCINVPTFVVTTFKKNISGYTKEGQPENNCKQGWGFYDLGLNNMLFLLKARELGLGTLVMGIRYEDKLKDMLHISDDEIIVSVIAVGYPDIDPSMPKRKELSDITKFY